MTVVEEARASRESDLLFPTATGRKMSDSTLSKLLRELGIGAVPHGFRSDVPRLVRREDERTT